MKILITGRSGSSGSFAIRGFQLGKAIGATVKLDANLQDCTQHDAVIVVKKVSPQTLQAIRLSGRPFIYDTVDPWPQSQPCTWNQSESIFWLRSHLAQLKPDVAVFGTVQMRQDGGLGGLVLGHHSWQKYVAHPKTQREQAKVIGYEGSLLHLGKWRKVLEKECKKRNLEFIINGDMTKVDAAVALRDGISYPAQNWKPATKLVNANALHIPTLCSREAGYEGVATGGEFWIDSEVDVAKALSQLSDPIIYKRACKFAATGIVLLDVIALQYKAWLMNVCR